MKLPPGHGAPSAPAYGGFGKAMLEKLGWSSGKGLGKNEDGMCDALAPKKKENTAGIGGTQAYPWQEKRWEKSFEAALQRLPFAADVAVDSSSDGSDSDDSDDADAPGAAPKGSTAAARRAAGAAASPSASDADTDSDGGAAVLRRGEAVGRDGIVVSGTRAELALARELAKDPWGRFGGREGKMARIAAAEAAAAAAAGRAHPPRDDAAEAARRREERKQRRAERAAFAAAEAAAIAGAAQVAAVLKQPFPAPRPVLKRPRSPAPAAAAAAPAAKPTSWWSQIFHSAGALVGGKAEARTERGFCEADQEALYNDAHGHKTEGRMGLGRRSDANPLKIGGARWAGSRVAFGDGGEAAAAAAEEANEEEEEDEGGADDLDAECEGEETVADVAADVAAAVAGLKWRKLAVAALAGGKAGGMKESKLRRATLAAAAAKLGWHVAERPQGDHAPEGGEAALRAAFAAADPLSSSRFVRLPCGRVALAAAAEPEAADNAADEPRRKKSKSKSKKRRAQADSEE